jgi:hypothetical protein
MLQSRKPLSRKSPLRARPIETRVAVKRKKKCQNPECREAFLPARMGQKACSVPCALVVGKVEAVKKEKKHDAVRREKLKTRSDYIKEAQREFNKYVRVRDFGKPCICCGQPLGTRAAGGDYDCGHYRSVGSAPHLRFDLRNAHAQRKQCNQWGAGRAVDYRVGLIARIGIAKVEAVEADQAPRKHDIEWLKRFTAIFRKKTRRLEKRRLQP